MTLTARIVAALILAALIPMAVVLAVPLMGAQKRAGEETARRVRQAQRQAEILVGERQAALRSAADHAADALAGSRADLAAVLRGPESVSRPVASALAGRFGLDRVEIVGAAGATLALFGAQPAELSAAELTERRSVAGEGEALTLVATRILAAPFADEVASIAGGPARLGRTGAPVCPEPRVEVPVAGGVSLCVGVTPADAGAVRRDLLGSLAWVAPIAFLAAVGVGLLLASRISRPLRDLAQRAEGISARHAGPITLLPEKDETRRMTIAFDRMLDAVDASERRRLAAERVAAWEEIARRLAHEIKNPLSPIQLAVENLKRTRERAPAEFDEAFAVETRTILEEVAGLRALVDEFSQFARLPRPHAAPCDPRSLVEQTLALFSGRIAAMGVSVTVDGSGAPASTVADAEQVARVLKNVVANALDAMEGSVERRLSISIHRERGLAVFTIRDSGRGFDREALRRVFEPYFTTRGDRGGTGLGMAIARRIAVEHGGSLTADGAPGRGATIVLTLPIAGPPAEVA
jgi:signal transduction histidine kinase